MSSANFRERSIGSPAAAVVEIRGGRVDLCSCSSRFVRAYFRVDGVDEVRTNRVPFVREFSLFVLCCLLCLGEGRKKFEVVQVGILRGGRRPSFVRLK